MILAVYFDGTIIEHRFPNLGNAIPSAIKTLKRLKVDSHILILWTYHSCNKLTQAVKYSNELGLSFMLQLQLY